MPLERSMLVTVMALAACGPAAKPATDLASKASPSADLPVAREIAGERDLCIDIADLQDEPIDFERLVAETPKLDLVDRPRVYEPERAFGTDGAFAQFSCRDGDCTAHLATLGGRSAPLPGLDPIPGTHTLAYDAALADVDSDGAEDIWISYIPTRVTDGDAPRDLDTVGRIAAYSLPDLVLQVHLLEFDRSDPDRPCEGSVYAVDANCDGSGDIVHLYRCADAECFSDHAAGTAACASSVQETRDLYLWNDTTGTYTRRVGSNP